MIVDSERKSSIVLTSSVRFAAMMSAERTGYREIIRDLSELDAETDRNISLLSAPDVDSRMRQQQQQHWAMAFNFSPHGIQTDDDDLSQLDCPPDYFDDYPGGGTDLADESGQRYDRLRFIVDVYVVGMLCIFGFVGNTLSIAVLRRDRLMGGRDAQNACTSCLLQALAGLNTVYLAACLVIQPAKTLVRIQCLKRVALR